jgi:uncharacterized protein with PIN domain
MITVGIVRILKGDKMKTTSGINKICATCNEPISADYENISYYRNEQCVECPNCGSIYAINSLKDEKHYVVHQAMGKDRTEVLHKIAEDLDLQDIEDLKKMIKDRGRW